MRTSLASSLVLALALALCACGGPAHPRLSQLNYQDGSRVLMTYAGDKIATAKALDADGKVTSDLMFVYVGDKISSVTITGSGSSAVTYTYTYLDGRLVSVTAKDYNHNITYLDGKVSKSVLSIGSGSTSMTTTVDYTYLNGRLYQRANTFTGTLGGLSFTSSSTDTFVFDGDGRLATITTTTKDSTKAATFAYDANGRLMKVVDGDETYTLEYLNDRVSRTTTTKGGSSTSVSYAYESGDVTGIYATPLVSNGNLFDAGGKLLPQDQLYFTSTLLGLD